MERQKLISVLEAGWREEDLADFASKHFRKAFFSMRPRDLMAIINSALYRDFFARRFLKRRSKSRERHEPTDPNQK